MRTPRKLTTGEPLTYAMGLEQSDYRGVPTILHGGVGTGHRAQTIRFPTLGAAVSVICNRADASHDGLSRAVADAWLGDRLAPVAATPRFQPAHVAAAGDYINERGLVLELRIEGDRATAAGLTGEPLVAAGADSFAFETGQRPARLQIQPGGALFYTPGQGRAVLYRRLERVAPAQVEIAAYGGRYQSPDYGTLFIVRVEEGELRLVAPSGLVRPLRPTTRDRFTMGRGAAFTFVRGADGTVRQLVVGTNRAKRVLFERIGP
jgi:hypothetical protein